MCVMRRCGLVLLGAILSFGLANGAQAADSLNLWVNGVEVTEANAADVLGAADGDAATVRYDAQTETIILNNATLNMIKDDAEDKAVVFSADKSRHLTVKLVGKNTITATDAAVINSYGALTLTGDGSLTAKVEGASQCVAIAGIGVTIDSGTYDVTSAASNAIYSYAAPIAISGTAKVTTRGYYGIQSGNVDAESEPDTVGIDISEQAVVNSTSTADNGFYTPGAITVSDNAEVTGKGYYAGLQGKYGIITIADKAKVTAVSSHDNGMYSEAGIEITGDAIVNATAERASVVEGGAHAAINGWGGVTISGGTVTCNSKDYGIKSDSSVTIGGDAIVCVPSAGDMAVYSGLDITIKEQATLEATAKDTALYGWGIYIKDAAKVTVTGPLQYGLDSSRDLEISGATVNISGTADTAINSSKALVIQKGAQVEVVSTGKGIYSNYKKTGSAITVYASAVNVKSAANQSISAENNSIDVKGAFVTVSEETPGFTPQQSVLINGQSGQAYGESILPPGTVTIPEGTTVTVPQGSTLSVMEGTTLVNKGTIVLETEGALINKGRIINFGEIQGTASGDGTWGVTGVGLNHKRLSLTEGDSAQLEAVLEPANATPVDVNWASSAADVVSVDGQGTLTAHKAGEATITLTVDGLTATCEVTVSAKSGGGSYTPSYAINVPDALDGGALEVSPEKAKAGAIITVTVTPDEGYALGTLTVTDNKGNAIDVTKKDDGIYTFAMPKGKVTVSATFVKKEAPVVMPFVDVPKDAWYHDAMYNAYESGLMVGTDATHFSPLMTTSRGMIVTMLYRLAGEPSLEDEIFGYPYEDVNANAYYANAVYWARMNDIVSGYSADKFGPNDPITREQLAGMLMRYSAWQGDDVSMRADLSAYSDADNVSGWAKDAVQWAVAKGYLAGTGNNTLSPQGQATRAQTAAVFTRVVSA